ncbi:class I SAM-dependent methyltransferase [Kordiimonas sp. SCSIO 12603]|uniref:SAM-dependent methyltransferase n=1 Tax=Kordiimonas sp. SCSIO 12603 TaxID=2829596 RepID=UPI002107D7CC|nr:cyclopropane-fatty-acyl-phospholipid synthase family protein [Kordiimonas sp. SCSIO 12603]UTW57829.1 class I SAM-dependent methyltransferase [Kordiimonas sp. SCSIO 12603]
MDGSLVNHTAEQKLEWRERFFASILSKIHTGQLEVIFPSGAMITFVGVANDPTFSKVAQMHIHSWSAINRAMSSGALGLGEGFTEGEWSSNDLTYLLSLLALNMEALESKLPSFKGVKFLNKLRHLLNRNTKAGSRRNISYHYDLGNDFYKLWLDKTMSYSAAIFKDDQHSLEAAQKEKYARLARELNIQPGDRVLEIGCGWGGFAEYAVSEIGCEIDCITLSKEQLAFAEQRLANAPGGENASFSLTDYRDVQGQYDKIVSIEMLEAVGEAFWPQYFEKIKSLLKSDGKAGIQVITIDDQRFETYRKGADFIQKHIFPGGMLPSDKVFKTQTGSAQMEVHDEFDFGLDYARTLACWRADFLEQLPAVKEQGFDDRFVRMWLFYLAYCEAGFLQNTISVKQYVIG